MTDKDDEKTIQKVVFAPGAFDDFEGTQEELDEFVAEIKKMFEGKTREELEADSNPLDIDQLLEEEPEVAEKLLRKLSEMDDDDRKLN